MRHREFAALHRIPEDIALERNTWFHLGANSDQQFIYCLKRLLEPIKEHVDNNFTPVPEAFMEEFLPIRERRKPRFLRRAQGIRPKYEEVLSCRSPKGRAE